MQYLLKIKLKDSAIWRLLAVDGRADLAFIAELISKSFPYQEGKRAFVIGEWVISAGISAKAFSAQELVSFDSLELHAGQSFIYIVNEVLSHEVEILKAVEHLDCLMPSVLMGIGPIVAQHNQSVEAINAYYASLEEPSLNLKELTNAMRTFGSVRSDPQSAFENVGHDLDFKLQ